MLSLKLEQFQIASCADQLTVSVDCSLLLQTASTQFYSLSNNELVAALCSGTSWVSRGHGYRLDFVIRQNDQHLPSQDTNELIGRYLQAAPVRFLG